MDKELRDLYAKFTGPSYSALLELKKNKEQSLLRAVEFKSPAELGYIVVGKAAYETIADLPEELEMVIKLGRPTFPSELLTKLLLYEQEMHFRVSYHSPYKTEQDRLNKEKELAVKLLDAMEMMKERQARRDYDSVYRKLNEVCPTRQLSTNGVEYVMKPLDMMLFIKYVPFKVLPKQLFKPFESSVKNFLTNHLFHFYVNKLMFKRPPSFPADHALPPIFNSLLAPNLAAIKNDMVHNMSHFALTYCLDWIAEILSLSHVQGVVKYGYPVVDVQGKTGTIPSSTSPPDSGGPKPPRSGMQVRHPPGGPQSRIHPQPLPAVQVPGEAAYHLSELPSRVRKPQQESSQQERYDQMPSRPDSRHEQPRQEWFQQEPWQQGPSRPEPWRRDPPQQEARPVEPYRQEPWRREPYREERRQEEPHREERSTQEPYRQERWQEEPRREERPSYEPPRQERAPYMDNSRPLSSEPDRLLDESDDWSEMLRMAQSDPKLPVHYKTMIGCLIASNRELSNILESLKS